MSYRMAVFRKLPEQQMIYLSLNCQPGVFRWFQVTVRAWEGGFIQSRERNTPPVPGANLPST